MKKRNYKLNIKEILKATLTFALFWYSSYFQLIPITLFNINLKNINGTTEVLLSSFSNTILLIILFIMYKKELKKEWMIFKSKFLDNIDIGFKYWIIGLFGMVFFNFIFNVLLQGGQANNEQAVQSMISSLPWLMVINAGFIAPIIEEIIFRKAFKNIFKNKWLFIVSSGIIFGLMHVITSSYNILDFLYFVPYSSLGLAFAYMYHKTDTVFTSTFMHIIHNTILILFSIAL